MAADSKKVEGFTYRNSTTQGVHPRNLLNSSALWLQRAATIPTTVDTEWESGAPVEGNLALSTNRRNKTQGALSKRHTQTPTMIGDGMAAIGKWLGLHATATTRILDFGNRCGGCLAEMSRRKMLLTT